MKPQDIREYSEAILSEAVGAIYQYWLKKRNPGAGINHRPTRKNDVGRNDPCPCGSGKRFKKCCLHTGFFSTSPTEGTMNANEWLQANNKEPYHPDDETSYDNWYWMTYLYYHGKVFTQEEIDAEGDGHWTLPIPVWNHLQSKTTYPYCKMYD